MIILRTVKNFSSLNIAASILLFLMAILAAVIANSPIAPLYQGLSFAGTASAHRRLQLVLPWRSSIEND